eukprot:m.279279 g.279279  ORF g.279279 m.279279 type:complete len:107 (+) comp19387_c0_seq4:569-889(+)
MLTGPCGDVGVAFNVGVDAADGRRGNAVVGGAGTMPDLTVAADGACMGGVKEKLNDVCVGGCAAFCFCEATNNNTTTTTTANTPASPPSRLPTAAAARQSVMLETC